MDSLVKKNCLVPMNNGKYIKKEGKEIFPINKTIDEKLRSVSELQNWEKLIFPYNSPSLQNRILELYKKSENRCFIEGVIAEYGLFNSEKNLELAYDKYRLGADYLNEYLSMYRLYSIHLQEYEKFGIKRDRNLEKYYLLKCFAYSPFWVIKRYSNIQNTIDLYNEIRNYINVEDEDCSKTLKLFDYLSENEDYKNIQESHLDLIKMIFVQNFPPEDFPYERFFEKAEKSPDLEMKYKLACLKEERSPETSKMLYELCHKACYYRSYSDYGLFLYTKLNEPEKAINIFKEGYENKNFLCAFFYYDTFLNENHGKIFQDPKKYKEEILYLFNILIDDILLGNCFGFFEFFFLRKLCIKHFGLKDEIKKFDSETKDLFLFLKDINEDKNLLNSAFPAKFCEQEFLLSYGYCYLKGIEGVIEPDIQKSLKYFKNSFKLSAHKAYKRFCYTFILKCRKILLKEGKISEEKFLKTEKKIFSLYNSSLDEFELKDLSSSFFYFLAKLFDQGIGVEPNKLKSYCYYYQSSSITNSSIGSGSIISYYRHFKSSKKRDENYKAIQNTNYLSMRVDNEGYGEDGSYCCICYTEKRNAILLPCLHQICKTCAEVLKKEGKCPICRGKIIKIELIKI